MLAGASIYIVASRKWLQFQFFGELHFWNVSDVSGQTLSLVSEAARWPHLDPVLQWRGCINIATERTLPQTSFCHFNRACAFLWLRSHWSPTRWTRSRLISDSRTSLYNPLDTHPPASNIGTFFPTYLYIILNPPTFTDSSLSRYSPPVSVLANSTRWKAQELSHDSFVTSFK